MIERGTARPMPPQLQPAPVVVAHPAATALAFLALRAEKVGKIERMIATVFEPASAIRTNAAWTNCTNRPSTCSRFRSCPRTSLMCRWPSTWWRAMGARSQYSLDKISQRILKHYRALAPARLSRRCRLSRAPVFHGHAFSIYLETGQAGRDQEFRRCLGRRARGHRRCRRYAE